MNPSPEENEQRSPDAPATAHIIPFERQSELQRAVQQRAQERIDAEAIKPKAPIARRLITFAVALIPVAIIFSGFLFLVHAIRVITSLSSTLVAPPTPPPVEAEAPQPGVIILVPDKALIPPAENSKESDTKQE